MTSEEILEQVQTAAGEAAEKLTLKKPASTVSVCMNSFLFMNCCHFVINICGGLDDIAGRPKAKAALTARLPAPARRRNDHPELPDGLRGQ